MESDSRIWCGVRGGGHRLVRLFQQVTEARGSGTTLLGNQSTPLGGWSGGKHRQFSSCDHRIVGHGPPRDWNQRKCACGRSDRGPQTWGDSLLYRGRGSRCQRRQLDALHAQRLRGSSGRGGHHLFCLYRV